MTTHTRLYTIKEAAPLMGMSHLTLRDKVNLGLVEPIPHLRIHGNKGVRFTEEHITAYLESCETAPKAVTDKQGADLTEGAAMPPASLAALVGVRHVRL